MGGGSCYIHGPKQSRMAFKAKSWRVSPVSREPDLVYILRVTLIHLLNAYRWNKHWFVLSEHVLYYFNSPGEDKPRLILPMDNVRVGLNKDSLTITLVSADGNKLKCTKATCKSRNKSRIVWTNANLSLQRTGAWSCKHTRTFH